MDFSGRFFNLKLKFSGQIDEDSVLPEVAGDSVQNIDIDFSSLTDEQVNRIANGEDPMKALADK